MPKYVSNAKKINHLIKSPFQCPPALQYLKKKKKHGSFPFLFLIKETGVKTQMIRRTKAVQSRHIKMERHPIQLHVPPDYTTTVASLGLCY